MNWLFFITCLMLIGKINSELLTIDQSETIIFKYQGKSLAVNQHTWRETVSPNQYGIFGYHFLRPTSLNVKVNQGKMINIEKIPYSPLWESHSLDNVRGFPGKPKMIFNGSYYLNQPSTIRIIGMISTRSFSGGCQSTSITSQTDLKLLMNQLPILTGKNELLIDLTLEQDPGFHSISLWGENSDLSFCACSSAGNGYQMSKHLMVVSVTPPNKHIPVISTAKTPSVIVETIYQVKKSKYTMINETQIIKQLVGDVLFDQYEIGNKRNYVIS